MLDNIFKESLNKGPETKTAEPLISRTEHWNF